MIHIAICGQMHGIMFWKHGSGWIRNENSSQQVSDFLIEKICQLGIIEFKVLSTL